VLAACCVFCSGKCVFLTAASLPGDGGAAAVCRRHYRRTLSAWLLVLYLLARVNMLLGAPAACGAVPGWLVTLCYFRLLNRLSLEVKHCNCLPLALHDGAWPAWHTGVGVRA
jgi:hypothetical protein